MAEIVNDSSTNLSPEEQNKILKVDKELNDIENESNTDKNISISDSGVVTFTKKTVKGTIDTIKDITEFVNKLIKLINSLPDLLQTILELPAAYIDYYLEKFNIVNLFIQKQILKLMIQKNKLLINIIRLIGSGSTKDTGNFPVFAGIDAAIKAIEIATITFINAFNALLTAILGNPLMALMPESMNFGITPKSMKPVTQIPVLTPNESITDVIMSEKVDTFIESLDITKRPEGNNIFVNEGFNKLIDGTNAVKDTVLNGIRAFGLTLLYNQEPLPKYEKLSITNLQFTAYILNSWGPTGKTCFGLPGYP